MLIGPLLPLLRRLSGRARMLIGAAAMAVGLALVLVLGLRGHPPGESVLLIRVGLLLAVAGPVMFATGVRGDRRGREPDGGDAEPEDDRCGRS
jgi:hypothetical protein